MYFSNKSAVCDTPYVGGSTSSRGSHSTIIQHLEMFVQIEVNISKLNIEK